MFSGYGCRQPKGPLSKLEYTPAELGVHDVEIEITHCGICYSDIHLIDDDWGRSQYPFIPGHEIVGRVTALGSEPQDFKIGDRVGVGWQRSACLGCEYCLGGNENLCLKQEATCVGYHGGFSDRIRTDLRFAFRIPEGLSSEAAAPLLCGGATVFAPLLRLKARAGTRVGVIGIGGLGHLALLFLKALGCETTAFSSSIAKREEALSLGATHFVSSTEPKEILKKSGGLDLILSTVHAKLDWISYLKALRPNGTLCIVGAPAGLIQIPPSLLITSQLSLSGSDIASRAMIVETLRFAKEHSIKPIIETAPLSEVNAALDRLRANQVRYRMVLTGKT